MNMVQLSRLLGLALVLVNVALGDRKLLPEITQNIARSFGAQRTTYIHDHTKDVLPASCGLLPPLSLAFGGVEDVDDVHKWVVYLEIQRPKMGRCVGTLIHERFVLTAAHCVRPSKPENIKLYFGLVLYSELQECLEKSICQERRVEEIIIHGKYNYHARLNDVALIRLGEAVTITDYVRPACLPLDYLFDEDAVKNSRVVSVGWGEYEEDRISDSKRIVQLRVIGKDGCKEQLRQWQRFNMSMIHSVMCTKGVQTGHDVCEGDGGAPILQYRHRRYHVIGVASFGPKCGLRSTKASVATRVSEYISWILNHLRRLYFNINESFQVPVTSARSNQLASNVVIKRQTPSILTGTINMQSSLKDVVPVDCGSTKMGMLHYQRFEDVENLHVWSVFLNIQRRRSNGRCVGTLIHERFVLTAAQCVYASYPKNIKLYFGLVSYSKLQQCLTDGVCQERQAAEIIVHPEYKSHSQQNDIAHIRLGEAANFTDYVGPACLPLDYQFEESLRTDPRVLSVGWNAYGNGPSGDSKRVEPLKVIEQVQCENQLKKWKRFKTSLSYSAMCTVGVDRGYGVCQGHEGTPLLQLWNQQFYVVGVVSFGPSCGVETDDANVATRVSEYLHWILDNFRKIKR